MTTIQQWKNFIRHGKQARAANAPAEVTPVHAQHQRYQDHQANVGVSEPAIGGGHHPAAQPPHDFTVAGDNRNIAAQAREVAANRAGDNQKVQKSARDAELERIVAEERVAAGKLPKYPGLERFTLIEKMGDGAFSNVYRAKDTTGKFGEVAVKVVRKFEMNSNQVCSNFPLYPLPFGAFLSRSLCQQRWSHRAMHICIQISRRCRKEWRCAISSRFLNALKSTTSTDSRFSACKHSERGSDHAPIRSP